MGTKELSDQGVSIWLDDINRENLQSGKLEDQIDTLHVVGVTTNPTIFATALGRGDAYDEQLAQLASHKTSVPESVFHITTQDVAAAADVLLGVYEQTEGYDGRVSIEVSPENAYDTEATVVEAQRLWDELDRPNVMIKVPATDAGIPAIRRLIGSGISVNVTLIFGLRRYREVIDAYLGGLEDAEEAGLDLSKIHSVASFFVSRVDTEVNKRLADTDEDTRAALLNKAAVANARLAYELFQEAFATDRARVLLDEGANFQRPLWASTGVKTDDLPDTYYVTELVSAETVNTMPEKTLLAVADHGQITGETIVSNFENAHEVMSAVAKAGIDLDDVSGTLEREGVEKFKASWQELGDTVKAQLAR